MRTSHPGQGETAEQECPALVGVAVVSAGALWWIPGAQQQQRMAFVL